MTQLLIHPQTFAIMFTGRSMSVGMISAEALASTLELAVGNHGPMTIVVDLNCPTRNLLVRVNGQTVETIWL